MNNYVDPHGCFSEAAPKGCVTATKLKKNYKPDFDFKKIKINDVGRYSITRPYEAKQISTIIRTQIENILKKDSKDCTITDGTSGVGGDTIHFSKYFKNVNAVDILKENIDLLSINCSVFNITNVNIIHNDYTKIFNILKQDVLYLDPPWGGIGYKDKINIELEMSEINISKLINLINKGNKCKPLIFLKLPLNVNLKNLNIYKKYKILNKKNIHSFFLVQIDYFNTT